MTTIKELERKAKELREVAAKPTEKEAAAAELARVEAEIAETREREAREAAEKRRVGIVRGHPSKCDAYEADVAKLLQKAEEFAAQAEKVKGRFSEVKDMEYEQAAGVHRFGLTASRLRQITAPALHPKVQEAQVMIGRAFGALPEHGHRPVAWEHDEHRLRKIRNYREIDGTDMHRIIQQAGLKPWPELTDRQREIIADRERQKAADAKTAAAFEREQKAVAAMPVPGEIRHG